MTDWLIPEWPAPASVKALCTTRRGGVSTAPFDELNLGLHVGDRAADVLANRVRLQAAIGGARPVFLKQVHGVGLLDVEPYSPDELVADASCTWRAGVACTIMVADCLPVLLCDALGRQVAAAHAGWRGLAGGVLESAVRGFKHSDAASSTAAHDLIAWLGPCIGPTAFEVGGEVRQAFIGTMPATASAFKRCGPDKWLADLAGLARLQLRALGINGIYGNDGCAAWCTVSNRSRFFSHRRDGVGTGGTGRFAACIWRVE